MNTVGLAWLLIVGTAIAGGCKPRESTTRNEESESAWHTALTALAKEHDAVLDWEANLTPRTMGTPFSIDVSRALIQSNGRPVVLVMELDDVLKREDGYAALFSETYYANQMFDLGLELKCTEQQANQILQLEQERKALRFAIVARIVGVSRPKFEPVGGSDGGDQASVKMTFSSDAFLANGVCVDLLPETGQRSQESKLH